MSLTRVVLTTMQAILDHKAFTPPNPTAPERRYHTEQHWLLQIAPAVFMMQKYFLWICASFEAVSYIAEISQYPLPPIFSSPHSLSPILILPTSNIRPTPFLFIGFLLVTFGAFLRLKCFSTLGQFFTFDLTIHPSHKLVTTGPYAWVRHPAYTGSMMMVAGIALSQLTPGSWMTECGPLRVVGTAFVILAVWWGWTVSVGVSRARAEDREMRKLFGGEWDAYAVGVPSWFLPGVC